MKTDFHIYNKNNLKISINKIQQLCQIAVISRLFMINIIPINDLKPHTENTTCACKPNILWQNEEMIVIHNSYDKRELDEVIKYNTDELKQVYEKGLLTKQDIQEMLDLAISEEEYEIAISIRDVLACL